jgi:thioredoxin reductase (NADPH)
VVDEWEHDVVIIGAGVAGVSAAIECFDIQLDVVLLDGAITVGGQIDEIPHNVRNVAVAPEGNKAISDALARHAATLGPRLHLDQPVTQVDLDAGLVVASGGRYHARCVLLTTGSIRRELASAQEGSFGGDVTYLVEPLLPDFARRPTAVFGGGDSALLDALALAEGGSPSVYLVHRELRVTARKDITGRFRSDSRITDLAGWELEKLVGSDHLEGVEVINHGTGEHRRLDVGGAVFKLGRRTCVDLVRDQVALGRRGGIVVDSALRTSHPRAFAAGDVVEGAYERIATAAGQGSYAAHSILTDLQSRS